MEKIDIIKNGTEDDLNDLPKCENDKYEYKSSLVPFDKLGEKISIAASEFENKQSEEIYNYDYQLVECVAVKYNSSSIYAKQIANLSEQIMKEHFREESVNTPNSKD